MREKKKKRRPISQRYQQHPCASQYLSYERKCSIHAVSTKEIGAAGAAARKVILFMIYDIYIYIYALSLSVIEKKKMERTSFDCKRTEHQQLMTTSLSGQSPIRARNVSKRNGRCPSGPEMAQSGIYCATAIDPCWLSSDNNNHLRWKSVSPPDL